VKRLVCDFTRFVATAPGFCYQKVRKRTHLLKEGPNALIGEFCDWRAKLKIN
jgi:hypothetical protein